MVLSDSSGRLGANLSAYLRVCHENLLMLLDYLMTDFEYHHLLLCGRNLGQCETVHRRAFWLQFHGSKITLVF
jgi:hypothetical protein